MTRLFLAASALLWALYGVYCFADPASLAGAAGVTATTATGTIELRAMYGGLQAALGLLAGAACWRPSLVRPALLALAFVAAGLFTARLLAAVVAAEFSAYTVMALTIEIVTWMFASRLLQSAGGNTDAAQGR